MIMSKLLKLKCVILTNECEKNHVGVVRRARLHLMNGKWSLHPEGIFVHATQHADVLVC